MLTNPLERARYLLEVKGSPLTEQDTLYDSEFLLEMMELNEKIAVENLDAVSCILTRKCVAKYSKMGVLFMVIISFPFLIL